MERTRLSLDFGAVTELGQKSLVPFLYEGLFYFETRFLGVSKFLILKPGFYRVSTKQIRDGNRHSGEFNVRSSCVCRAFLTSSARALVHLLLYTYQS